MKKILLINTGGTIAMSEDQTSGKVSPKTDNPLTEQATILQKFVELSIIDFYHVPSPHMTIQKMLELSQYITSIQSEYDGIVITHGTDTLEETAYFLDLTIKQEIPIVMTGAMRSSNEIGSDGLANLRSAIFVAAASETKQHGVVIVMNEEIHAAAFVTKTHTTNLATFQTPTFGPVGIISKNNVLYFQNFKREPRYQIESINKRVGLVKAYADMQPDVLEVYRQYDGLVIEGLGAGNLPPQVIDILEELINMGVKVIMVSRAFNGITEDVYDYAGGGKRLRQLGVIYTQGLSGVKARLKLLVALSSNIDVEQLRHVFSHQILVMTNNKG